MQTNSQSRPSEPKPNMTKTKYNFTPCTCVVCPYSPYKHGIARAAFREESNNQLDETSKKVLNKAGKASSANTSAKASSEKIDKQLNKASKRIAIIKICTENITDPWPCEEINKQLTNAMCCEICFEVCRVETATKKVTETTNN